MTRIGAFPFDRRKEVHVRRLHDDSGQGNAEYALIIVVVLAIFGVLLAVSNSNAPAFFSGIWQKLISAVS